MVSAVSSSSAFVSASSNSASPTAAADRTINMLLQNSDLQQYLSERTSTYLPVTTGLVLSTLWAGINVNGNTTINESDLYKAVVSEGGKSSDAHALWLQLAPPDADGNSKTTMNAADFAYNSYLMLAISSNMTSLKASLTKLQQQQGPSANNSLFSTFNSLDGGRSPIGSGYFINVFV